MCNVWGYVIFTLTNRRLCSCITMYREVKKWGKRDCVNLLHGFNNNNNNNNSGHLLCTGIRPKTLMAQAIIITLSLSGNHQNHFAFCWAICSQCDICDISLNKYRIRSGRQCKQGKVICPGSQHVGRSGARTNNLPFMSPALFCYRPHGPSCVQGG